MPSRFARGVESLLRTTQTLLMQIAVSVATALCVAYITSAYLDRRAEPPAVAARPPAEAPAATPTDARSPAEPRRATLPPLEAEVIADLPDLARAEHEVFPGVPAEMSVERLREAVVPTKQEPRRLFGLAIPFT